MTTKVNISVKDLELLKFHATQVEAFLEHLGQGLVEITVDLASVFDWDYASKEILGEIARKSYEAVIRPAREASVEAIQVAQEAYETKTRPARETWNETIQPTLQAYTEKETQSSLQAYDRTARAALETYVEATYLERKALEEAIKIAQETLNIAKFRAFAEAYIAQSESV